MTTTNQWARIKKLSLLRAEAERQGCTFHGTKAGYLIRRNGRIIHQAFSLERIEKIIKAGL